MEPRYTLTNHGWSCGDCGALVVVTATHDAWHQWAESVERRMEDLLIAMVGDPT